MSVPALSRADSERESSSCSGTGNDLAFTKAETVKASAEKQYSTFSIREKL
jgi:hypothetical protein